MLWQRNKTILCPIEFDNLHPAPCLLKMFCQGGTSLGIMCHWQPQRDGALSVEKNALRMVSLGSIFLHQQQLGTKKVPVCIADVTSISCSLLLARSFHPKFLLGPSPLFSTFLS